MTANPIIIHDFHGGIHPNENKQQSTQTEIIRADIPNVLVLPIAQHIGAKSKPVVNIGDAVLKGQVIAEADGFVSANLHAPTSGTIVAIEHRVIAHPSGMSDICIVIEPDFNDEWISLEKFDNPLEVDRDTLISKIEESGITGLGGAGFPTHVKACVPQERIETLIINAAECEPYITADDMLMRTYAHELIKGIEVLCHIFAPVDCYIGIEDNKPEAIEALNLALSESNDDTHMIHVVTIPTKYPSGGEKQLIQILTGKEVPAKGLPADIGILCQNVGTALAIYEATYLGQPLIKRITTVTGEACGQKANYETLLGTPVHSLLQQSQTDFKQLHRLIMGGPMMGFTLETDNVPVVKSTNCLIASTKHELPDPNLEQPCIRCGMCTEACPAQLLPQQLYWFSKSDNLEQAEQHNIADCIECGACAYVCPSNIPLVQYYRHTKGEIKQAHADKIKSDRAKERYEARIARQEREAAEKEAKRKARAEAAAKKQAAKAAEQSADTQQIASDKSKEKALSAEAQFESGLENQPATTSVEAPQPSIEQLEKKVLAAQTRVDKAQERLAMAKEQQLDTVPALETGLEKQKQKLADARKTLEEAKA
ncbi:electron transport complex subunit RsxC [Bermanella sp. R86510]|uniref:electron transport complex subunit RsxC n=1 Tax=unclassified Bermanella TaxID=2627862 RepID=UPI0037C9854D